MQSAIGSRVFRAVLPGRIYILSGSKALQAPCVQFSMLPTETSFYVAEVSSRSLWSSLCCSRGGILAYFYRIGTCNIHSSTKVSGLRIHYLFLCLQCFHRLSCFHIKFQEFQFYFGNFFMQVNKICVFNYPSKSSHNSYKIQ